MTKKRILLVAPFTLLPGEEGDNRFRYIAELLSSQHDVTLATSSFHHPKKKQRPPKGSFQNLPYTLILIQEPGYQRNVGLKRILSHRTFQKNLKTFLAKKNGQFDSVYAAFPMIGSAQAAGRFAQQNNIPFYLDVQDIWPESILVYTGKLRGLTRLVLAPLTQKANAVYQMADAVIAVSQTYVNRVMAVNTKAQIQMPLYIGISLQKFDAAAQQTQLLRKKDDDVIGVYSGSFSHSYDVETVIRAAALLKNVTPNFRLVILGSGPFETALKQLAKTIGAPVEFLGYRPFDEMAGVLAQADIGFHAIATSSQSSMTNKFADYCAAGLAILNSSPSPEIRSLVNTHKLGLNYSSGDHQHLAELISGAFKEPAKIKQYGQNCRAFAEQHLDREKTYDQLFDLFC